MRWQSLVMGGLISLIACGQGGPYEEEVLLFEQANGLPPAWADWMIENQNVYATAYNVARGDRSVRIEVRYAREISYDPPWESEEQHMAALEQAAELQFPGWDFTFSRDDPDADVVAVLGHTGKFSYADVTGKTIYLIYEGIFAHEFAHTLGLQHHFCVNPEDTVNCGTLPPGEGACIMAMNSESWGPTEQFLLRLSGDRPDDEISQRLNNLNDRYPAGYPNDR